jgi:hypothetical protein
MAIRRSGRPTANPCLLCLGQAGVKDPVLVRARRDLIDLVRDRDSSAALPRGCRSTGTVWCQHHPRRGPSQPYVLLPSADLAHRRGLRAAAVAALLQRSDNWAPHLATGQLKPADVVVAVSITERETASSASCSPRWCAPEAAPG